MEFNTTEELIGDIRQGKLVILVDDEDRENEGDLILAAEFVTPEIINFMAKEARGLICLAMSSSQIDQLKLPLMVRDDMNLSPNKTAFTVSIEAAHGVTTGISAADRSHTIKVAIDPKSRPSDIHTPGHIFPIKAQYGGVLKRAGHTEGSVDLAILAGLRPAAVICEVMNPDGTMARVSDLKEFARSHGLKIGTIVDLIEYRLAHETLVEEIGQYEIPQSSLSPSSKLKVFKNKLDGTEHLVFQKGEISPDQPISVRIQLDHFSREFLSLLNKNESPLVSGIKTIQNEKNGIFVLLRDGSRSMGLKNEIEVFLESNSQSQVPKVTMDERDYGIGAQILRHLGVRKIRLFTNHPEKKVGLKAYHLEIVETVPLFLSNY